MGRITGLGGPFIKVKDPKALAAWYEKYLGVPFHGGTYCVLPLANEEGKPDPGFNILTFFPQDSDYFKPSTGPVMVNFRVSGLHELLKELKDAGVTLAGEPQDTEYGKFGWILDIEGNKVELWEPPAE